jgi:hypothetical protein
MSTPCSGPGEIAVHQPDVIMSILRFMSLRHLYELAGVSREWHKATSYWQRQWESPEHWQQQSKDMAAVGREVALQSLLICNPAGLHYGGLELADEPVLQPLPPGLLRGYCFRVLKAALSWNVTADTHPGIHYRISECAVDWLRVLVADYRLSGFHDDLQHLIKAAVKWKFPSFCLGKSRMQVLLRPVLLPLANAERCFRDANFFDLVAQVVKHLHRLFNRHMFDKLIHYINTMPTHPAFVSQTPEDQLRVTLSLFNIFAGAGAHMDGPMFQRLNDGSLSFYERASPELRAALLGCLESDDDEEGYDAEGEDEQLLIPHASSPIACDALWRTLRSIRADRRRQERENSMLVWPWRWLSELSTTSLS